MTTPKELAAMIRAEIARAVLSTSKQSGGGARPVTEGGK